MLRIGTCTAFVFPGLALVDLSFLVSLEIMLCFAENNSNRRLLFYLQQYKNLSSLMIVFQLSYITEQKFVILIYSKQFCPIPSYLLSHPSMRSIAAPPGFQFPSFTSSSSSLIIFLLVIKF